VRRRESFFGFAAAVSAGAPGRTRRELALPNRPGRRAGGDGSSMYTNQALWTAARESLAVVYVIFNNASYES
jgi:acetolactate synthase-1/2/3 large subunit